MHTTTIYLQGCRGMHRRYNLISREEFLEEKIRRDWSELPDFEVRELSIAAELERNGCYAAAIRIYESLVALGNDIAIKSLGYIHYYGLGCKANYKKSMEYFRKAATEQADGQAWWILGCFYRKGLGCRKNIEFADACVEKARVMGYDFDKVLKGKVEQHIRNFLVELNS